MGGRGGVTRFMSHEPRVRPGEGGGTQPDSNPVHGHWAEQHSTPAGDTDRGDNASGPKPDLLNSTPSDPVREPRILLPLARRLEGRLTVSQSVSRQASSQSGSQSGKQAGRQTGRQKRTVKLFFFGLDQDELA